MNAVCKVYQSEAGDTNSGQKDKVDERKNKPKDSLKRRVSVFILISLGACKI